jgi:hypothetical protein
LTPDPNPTFAAGQYVRFKLPSGSEAKPMKISGVTIRGLLYIEGFKGTFDPNLFELAEAPKEQTA